MPEKSITKYIIISFKTLLNKMFLTSYTTIFYKNLNIKKNSFFFLLNSMELAHMDAIQPVSRAKSEIDHEMCCTLPFLVHLSFAVTIRARSPSGLRLGCQIGFLGQASLAKPGEFAAAKIRALNDKAVHCTYDIWLFPAEKVPPYTAFP